MGRLTTETTFDTAIHQVIGRRHRFEIADVRMLIFVDDNAGVKQAIRIKKRFDFLHQGVALFTPFQLNVRGHVASCTVFGFQ